MIPVEIGTLETQDSMRQGITNYGRLNNGYNY